MLFVTSVIDFSSPKLSYEYLITFPLASLTITSFVLSSTVKVYSVVEELGLVTLVTRFRLSYVYWYVWPLASVSDIILPYQSYWYDFDTVPAVEPETRLPSISLIPDTDILFKYTPSSLFVTERKSL